jgi:hypothetical protein
MVMIMSVSALGSAVALAPTPAIAQASVRTASGDYTKPTASTSQVKDSDGDYKPSSASPAATGSSAVLTALNSLQIGG